MERLGFSSRILWLLSTCLVAIRANSYEFRDFLAKNRLVDGELETRIRFRGVTAKETTVSAGNNTGITFRQLTDGRHFIHLIYDSTTALRDCEYMPNDSRQVHKFLSTFTNDMDRLELNGNLTMLSLDHDKLPPNVQRWFSYGKLRNRCRRVQLKLRQEAERVKGMDDDDEDVENEVEDKESPAPPPNHLHATRRHKRSIHYVTRITKRMLGGLGPKFLTRMRSLPIYPIHPGTQWCGMADRARKYTDIGGEYAPTDMCCRKHDICRLSIPANGRRFQLYNSSPFTRVHCQCDRSLAVLSRTRSKRDLSDLFRMPGTKWCGKGYSATKFTQLGGFTRTDKCCRLHDTACPFWIAGFQHKYGMFNWRVNTLMHCSCDERFRTCLKMVDTSDSNLIGKIFFNVVQTKCFVLKPKRVCIRRSWWGKKCLKSKVTKKAILRDNLPY